MTEAASSIAEQAPPAAAAPLSWARSRLFEFFILVWSLLFGLSIVVLFHHIKTPKLVRRILWTWCQGFIHSARLLCGVKWRIEGGENVPDGPVIYVGNHQAYWESIGFCAFVPDICVIAKAQTMKMPVFGWGLRHAPMPPVERDRPGGNLRRILRDTKAAVDQGRDLLLFPEGTRVLPGKRQPYQRGLELVYRNCDIPIVPFVHNSGLLWPKGFGTKQAGTITVKFLPPIQPGGDPIETVRKLERLLNTEKDALLESR
ncbi:MAG: lysophospholipid acyltransferase family protein [Paracoccaceae bacterium]